ncbi:site-2 protease family protein [soil metagenome]
MKSPAAEARTSLRTNFILFVATLASVFLTYYFGDDGEGHSRLGHALMFTGSLMGILSVHEFSHWIAAKIHKVDASPPFFIPLPILSPFGTMGAVIRLRGTIPTRRALLDIGASGPLGGLAVAIPLYAWGIAHSAQIPLSEGGGQLGESLLLKTLDHLFAPTPGEGMDLLLHPVAFGAWGGMLVTMLNLLPVSQLDGGHVAYALFGPRQDKIARSVHRALLLFFFLSLGSFFARDFKDGLGFENLGKNIENSSWWLFWFQMLGILGALNTPSRKDGELPEGSITVRTRVVMLVALLAMTQLGESAKRPLVWVAWFINLAILLAIEIRSGTLRDHVLLDHPSTGSEPLGIGRKAIAVFTLAMFVILFMPTPFQM